MVHIPFVSSNGLVTVNFNDNMPVPTYNMMIMTLGLLERSSFAGNFFGKSSVISVVNDPNESYWDHTAQVLHFSTISQSPDGNSHSYFSLLDGRAHVESLQSIFVHELTHALVGKFDLIDLAGNPIFLRDISAGDRIAAMLADPTADFMGETVRMTNAIMTEISGPEARGHYLNTGTDVDALAKAGVTTNGQSVDAVIFGGLHGARDLTIDRGTSIHAGKPEIALIIGGDGNEKIAAGGGRDYVYGGAGDDILVGGKADFNDLSLDTAHPEWDDGETDQLSGGAGRDEYYIYSNHVVVETPLTDPSVADLINNQIDFVDATDQDFKIHFQFHDSDGRVQSLDLTPAMVRAGVDSNDGLPVYKFGTKALDGYTGHIMGQEIGDKLVVFVTIGYQVAAVLGGFYNWPKYPQGPVIGTPGNDTFYGSSGNDHIYGGDGSDTFHDSAGDDIYDGDHAGPPQGNRNFVSLTQDGNGWVDQVVFDGVLSDYIFTLNADGSATVVGASSGSDKLIGIEVVKFSGDNTVYQLSDLLAPSIPTPTVVGTSGDDHLTGTDGNDVFDSLGGNDNVNGGEGSDTYLYSVNDGDEYIDDEAGSVIDVDVLKMKDLNYADVTFTHDSWSSNLVLTVNSTNHVITLDEQYYAASEGWGLERIDFADGISVGLQHSDEVWSYKGSKGNDHIVGAIWGKQDIFEGGKGNDFLSGEGGSDIYIYSKGDGSDIIHDGVGFTDEVNVDVLKLTDLNQADLSFARDGTNLKITVNQTGETITVDDQFYRPDENYGVEKIEFADGSSWDLQDIWQNVPAPSAQRIAQMSASTHHPAPSPVSNGDDYSADIIRFPTTASNSHANAVQAVDPAVLHHAAADGNAGQSADNIISLQDFLHGMQNDDHATDLWFEPEPIGSVI